MAFLNDKLSFNKYNLISNAYNCLPHHNIFILTTNLLIIIQNIELLLNDDH